MNVVPIKNLITAVREAMWEEMERDRSIFVIGEDVGARGGVFLATEGLLGQFGENRVIDAPLGEASIIGIAAGAALAGMRPIAEVQFADFMWPAVSQLVGEVARARYGSNGALSIPLVVRSAYGGGVHGGLYHSQSLEGYLAHCPGLQIVCPATPYDAKGLLKSALRGDDPVVFFEHKRSYRAIHGEVPEHDYTVPIGQAEIKRSGQDVSVITYGPSVHTALEAAQAVAQEGVSVEIVDLRTVHPLDVESILRSVAKTGRALIVHEDNLTGGVGAEVAALIAEKAFQSLDGPVTRLCGPDIPAVPFAPNLEELFMLNSERIVAAIHALRAY